MTRAIPLLLAAAAAAATLTGVATAYEPTLWCMQSPDCPYPCQRVPAGAPGGVCMMPLDFIPVPPTA